MSRTPTRAAKPSLSRPAARRCGARRSERTHPRLRRQLRRAAPADTGRRWAGACARPREAEQRRGRAGAEFGGAAANGTGGREERLPAVREGRREGGAGSPACSSVRRFRGAACAAELPLKRMGRRR